MKAAPLRTPEGFGICEWVQCGKPYQPKTDTQRYCAARHGKLAWRDANREKEQQSERERYERRKLLSIVGEEKQPPTIPDSEPLERLLEQRLKEQHDIEALMESGPPGCERTARAKVLA